GVNGSSSAPTGSTTTPVEITLDDDAHPADKAAALGRALARFGDIFAGHNELLVVSSDRGELSHIRDGKGLARLLVDHVRIRLVSGAEKKAGLPPTSFLEMILGTKQFLDHFRPVDVVTDVPLYLSDFTLTMPGYNDGGPGHRVVYTGQKAQIGNALNAINR